MPDRNQNSFLNLFYKLPRNFIAVFSGTNLLWHLSAIVLTYVVVVTDFDWTWFKFFRNTPFYSVSFAAAIIGGLAPILVPLIIYLVGLGRKKAETANLGLGLGQAALLGWIVSSIYKAFTGRIPPELNSKVLTDISHGFQLGFFRGGIFWGWPSSHTATAFAMSVALLMLFPGNKKVKYLSIIYALFIGLSVSISIHWFSEFIAGAIIGTVIGMVVGKSFYSRKLSLMKV